MLEVRAHLIRYRSCRGDTDGEWASPLFSVHFPIFSDASPGQPALLYVPSFSGMRLPLQPETGIHRPRLSQRTPLYPGWPSGTNVREKLIDFVKHDR